MLENANGEGKGYKKAVFDQISMLEVATSCCQSDKISRFFSPDTCTLRYFPS
jgi:hypothetical protein